MKNGDFVFDKGFFRMIKALKNKQEQLSETIENGDCGYMITQLRELSVPDCVDYEKAEAIRKFLGRLDQTLINELKRKIMCIRRMSYGEKNKIIETFFA